MNKIYTFTVLFAFFSIFSINTFAQELDELLDDSEPEYESMFFKSTRIINGHAVETQSKGVLDFRINHRFGSITNEPVYNFFGLDQSNVRIGFDYGFNDRLTAGIGRSSYLKSYDSYLKYNLLKQKKGDGSPIAATAVLGGSFSSIRFVFNQPVDRFAYFGQLIAARKFSDNFTLQLSGTGILRNYNYLNNVYNSRDIVLGLGGRNKISNRLAITYDTYLPSSYLDANNGNDFAWALGLDIETGGHVFQLHLTNTFGNIERDFMTEIPKVSFPNNIYFGFNISRVFQLK
jgi:hypothetical protein